MPLEKLPTPHEVVAMTDTDREEIITELMDQIDADQRALSRMEAGPQRENLCSKILNYQSCLRFCRMAHSKTYSFDEEEIS